MTKRERRGTTAGSLIFTGLLVALLFGVCAAIANQNGDENAALFIAVPGGVISVLLLLTGVIAKGVEIGNRASRRTDS